MWNDAFTLAVSRLPLIKYDVWGVIQCYPHNISVAAI